MSLYTERRSEFRVYLRRETGTTVTLRREQLRRRIPLSLAYNLNYGRTEATEVSFCASFNACTPDVVTLLRQNRVLATLTGTASVPRVNNLLDPSRGSLKSLEVAVSSRFLGSASFQQFTRVVADAAWYRPVARNVVLSWHLRGGTIFSPTVDVASERGSFIPPEQRFYAGGPNDVRGFERNELGPVVYVVSKGEVDNAAAQSRGINPDSVQVSATGGNTLAIGNIELRVPSPVFSSRLRLAAFVDAGGAWQRGDRRPGDSGDARGRHPSHHPAGAGPARPRLQPVSPPGRPALPVRHHRRAGSRCRARSGSCSTGRAGSPSTSPWDSPSDAAALARLLFVFVLGSVAMVLGVVTSMILTPPGRDLLARTVSRMLDRVVLGHIDVGAISGSFLYDLVLEDLVVRDTSGVLLADLPRVRVGYRLPNLIAGQVVLSSVQLERPVIQLIKHRSGRMNYEEVLRLGKGAPGRQVARWWISTTCG